MRNIIERSLRQKANISEKQFRLMIGKSIREPIDTQRIHNIIDVENAYDKTFREVT